MTVGELNKNKNQQVIIKAIALLDDPTVHYVLCGKGNQKENLEKLSRKHGVENHVHFLGYRKDIADVYYNCDLMAFPSKREGLGLAALEAMYCGLPLVASDSRGIRDVLINDSSKYLYAANDIRGFSRGIKTFRRNRELYNISSRTNQELVRPFCIESSLIEVCNLIRNLV